MAAEMFNKTKIQYKCATFIDGKTNFRSLSSGYWYPESNLPYVKSDCVLGHAADEEFMKYLQDRIDTYDFQDTTSADGTVYTADWHRQMALKGIEDTKKRTYKVVYHDSEYIYDYETKEPLMSVADYLAQVNA